MVEKKSELISVRVPGSWKRTLKERGIEISYVCRSALYQALNQTDPVLKAGAKLRSKQRAAALFNALQPILVRTFDDKNARILSELPFKIQKFREILMPGATPSELQVLGEFLDQGEYAEEILQDVYV